MAEKGKIVDQWGNEISTPAKPSERVVGAQYIQDILSDYPDQGLDPSTLAALLKDADAGDVARQCELFEGMEEKDGHLMSVMQTRKNAVVGLPWDIEPFDDSHEAARVAEFIKMVFTDLPNLNEVILNSLDAVGKGFSIQELHWDISKKGENVINNITWIHPKKALFYDHGMTQEQWGTNTELPRIITEAEQYKGEAMPDFKMIFHVYKARSGFTTRAGLLRPIVWWYLFKNMAVKDWVQFAEIYGMPLRVGRYESGASTDAINALKTALRSLGADAAGLISKDMEIELHESTNGKGGENLYLTLAEYCDKMYSKVILGQTLTTESGDVGSFALGRVQDLVRHDLIEADAGMVSLDYTNQVIYPLVGFNFGWETPLPKFVLKFDSPEDLKTIGEYHKTLQDMGYDFSEEYISNRFKVPIIKDGEKPLKKPAAPSPFGGPPAPEAPLSIRTALARKLPQDQVNLDGLVDEGVEEAIKAMARMREDVRQVILKAKSYQDIKEGLIKIYPDLDTEEFENLALRVNYVAQLYGRSQIPD